MWGTIRRERSRILDATPLSELAAVAGSAHLHTLNREHLAVDAFVQLASVRNRLIWRIIDEVQA